jgi:hypothetical protein
MARWARSAGRSGVCVACVLIDVSHRCICTRLHACDLLPPSLVLPGHFPEGKTGPCFACLLCSSPLIPCEVVRSETAFTEHDDRDCRCCAMRSPSPYGPFQWQEANQPDGLPAGDLTLASAPDGSGSAYLVREGEVLNRSRWMMTIPLEPLQLALPSSPSLSPLYHPLPPNERLVG